MEAFCKGHGSGSTWRGRGFNSAMILTGFKGQKASNFCHDRTTIRPRSCVDRDLGAPSIVVGSSRIDSAAEDVRSRLDRGSIGPRSWGSSMPCLRRPMMLQLDERSRLV